METIYRALRKEIKLRSYTDHVYIWFFGDVHRDAKSCDVDRWKSFLKRSKDNDKNTYFMGLGDYHDFASDREQRKLLKEGYDLHETTIENIHQMVERRNRDFAKEIKHMRGKILGLVDGNHNWRFENGKTASEDLADRMGCDHMGWLCYYSISFSFESVTRQTSVDIVACHGTGGGKRAGASVNQVEDLTDIFPLADIYVMGHDHKLWAYPKEVLYRPANFSHIKQKTQYLCRAGSFKKAYEPNRSGYEIGRLLKPATLGALRLKIGFERIRAEGRDILRPKIEATI